MYEAEGTISSGRQRTIVIDVQESFKVKSVILDGGRDLLVVEAYQGDRKLISSSKKLTTVSGLLNLMLPEVTMGKLTFVILNPRANEVWFKITIR